MSTKFHSLKVKEVTRETDDTVSILFDVPESLQFDFGFKAGQYLTLRKEINGEEVRRSYSICSAPHSNELRVAVKQVENGLFSTFANKELAVGDSLESMTPAGNFVVNPEPNSSKSYALFAAGSGITPIISILKSILHEEPNSKVNLFLGNKSTSSIIFKNEIDAIERDNNDTLKITHVLSQADNVDAINRGRIDSEKAKELYNSSVTSPFDAIYICGPEGMILDVKDAMKSLGVSDEKIHFELFTTPTESVKPSNTNNENVEVEAAAVTVIVDDEETHFTLGTKGSNILDAGQDEGADLPFACKGGVCCTCKAKILEGSASMDANYSLEEYEVEDGYILTCQAHPTSEKLVISFDE